MSGKLRGKNYRDYLQSPGWKARRRVALEAAGERCQLCNASGPLHVHHRTHERVGREQPGDLTVLCAPCHRRHHRDGQDDSRAKRRREIDEDILLTVRTAGLVSWRDVQRQIKAPRAQAWARANRLVKHRRLAWKHGKLCLYSQRDLV